MLPHDTVWEMWTCYEGGLSLVQVGKLFGKGFQDIRKYFLRRGLQTRRHGGPARPHTEAEISKMLAGMKRIHVPEALKHEWRSWPMARRVEFIHRARARLGSKCDMPEGPLSSNVKYFEYGSPAAMAIAQEMNRGKSSQCSGMKMKPCSRGLIWEGRLWFWAGKDTDYEQGLWNPVTGRLCLHRAAWEHYNGRPVPPKHQVVFRDGNGNNFSPKNLALRSKADCCWENRKKHFDTQGREATALLLQASQRKETNANHKLAQALRLGRGR
jgi:hypothetical protein